MTVSQMCDWYLTEARAGNILGRKNRPIKESSLKMDESRINTHIKPLLGKRHAKHLTIAEVEQMQSDVRDGKTAKARGGGRGGKRSEEHTSELQSLMRISYAVFCLNKKKQHDNQTNKI